MEARKLTTNEKTRILIKGKNTIEKVDKTLTDELFIAICSPIGSLKERVIDMIKHHIQKNYNYAIAEIKLSKFIDDYVMNDSETGELHSESSTVSRTPTPIYQNYIQKIMKGNVIRKHNNNSYLAERAIEEIHLERLNEAFEKGISDPKPEDFESKRKLYIIDSIKSKEELDLFRKVYTENFYQISLFSSLEDRKKNLGMKGFKKTEIEDIIEIDDKQSFNYGQNVRGTFVEGDFFMRISELNDIEIEKKVKRFFDLIFESSIITPTTEEKSMYLAKSAAGNSACLSRQVGACIIDQKGNVLSTGWNDVPKFGGNLYSEGNDKDNRCFNTGYCSNDFQKDKLVDNLLEVLTSYDELKSVFYNGDTLNINLIGRIKKRLRDSKVRDLIEFSRSVHAEMHAIIQGAQLSGDKMINGRLFCTTYPCHNCARHIIAAGIKEVYYIEPYVKSLCLTLHSDSMTENVLENDKVKLLMFDGVAPRNYLTFFTNFAERKTMGKVIKRDLKSLKPKKAKSLQALSTLEQQAIHSLSSKDKHEGQQ